MPAAPKHLTGPHAWRNSQALTWVRHAFHMCWSVVLCVRGSKGGFSSSCCCSAEWSTRGWKALSPSPLCPPGLVTSLPQLLWLSSSPTCSSAPCCSRTPPSPASCLPLSNCSSLFQGSPPKSPIIWNTVTSQSNKMYLSCFAICSPYL